jgi:predicted DNA-binding transcriptional regulator AlpA
MSEFVSEKEVCERLGLGRTSLWRMRKVHDGPAYAVIGGRIVYRWLDVEAWFESNKRLPAKSAYRLRLTR